MMYLYLWLFIGAVSAAWFWYEGNDRQFDFNFGWLAFCLFLVLLGPITTLFCLAGCQRSNSDLDDEVLDDIARRRFRTWSRD